MQQHPVPQNITGFEFKLIGFLTLRQFGYLAFAGIIDIVLYAAQLPFLVVILIGGPFSLLAVALALFKINDQPFERWLVAFIKTIYAPTIRVWRREAKNLGFLEPQFSSYLQAQQTALGPKVVSDRSKLDAYLKSHTRQETGNAVDENEEKRLAQLPFATGDRQVFVAPNLNVPQAEFTQTIRETQPRFQRLNQIASESKESEK
ncbi:MAG TPA: PrgI family protein [Candidatus Nanoarchaeia archaeon]